MLRRSPLRGDCTAVLAPGSCRVTHFAPCGRCVRTDAASQMGSALRAPTPALRSSPPHKSPLPGAACRECGVGVSSSCLASAAAKPVRGRARCARCDRPRSLWSAMAHRVTPTEPYADSPSGSFTPAASNDWRRADAASMSARAPNTQPTTVAGHVTTGSSLGALTRSVSHWRWRGSPHMGLASSWESVKTCISSPSPEEYWMSSAVATKFNLKAGFGSRSSMDFDSSYDQSVDFVYSALSSDWSLVSIVWSTVGRALEYCTGSASVKGGDDESNPRQTPECDSAS
jgi:hypothetical protein